MKPYFIGMAANIGLTFLLVLFIGAKGFSPAAQILCLALSGFVVGKRFSFSAIGMVCALPASSFFLFMVLSGGFSSAAFILFAELVAVGAFAAFAGIGLGVKRREALNKRPPPTADAPGE